MKKNDFKQIICGNPSEADKKKIEEFKDFLASIPDKNLEEKMKERAEKNKILTALGIREVGL